MGRMIRRALVAVSVLVVLGALIGVVGVAAAARVPGTELRETVSWATFEPPSATATFGESVVFEQRVAMDALPARVEILLEFPGALGPHVVEVPTSATLGATVTLRHVLSIRDGHIAPNTTIGARWRIVGRDGSVELGPRASVRYDDTRFAWKTQSGERVRVHWYSGSDAFGKRALEIGERAVAETGALLGVDERDPIDFFIYAKQDPFYDALGPGTRENVGGQANASIRTLFALIEPGAINDPWVGIVIPHELTHLVFDTAVDNPYHFPPRWLNEGLAVYLSAGNAASDRREVSDAVRRDALTPLSGLTGQFPTTRDEFFLAYAESVSAVDYLVKTYGRDALVRLIQSYADGTTDDEAFTAALGVGVAEFDAAWRSSVGASPPIEYGPRPAPPGPVPPDWDVPVVVGGGPGPGPSAGPTAAPGSPPGSDAASALPVVGGIVALAVLGVGAAWWLTRRPKRDQA